jgi:transporter family-2 protein
MQWWAMGFALAAASLLPVQGAMLAALNRALAQPPLVVLISLTGSAIFMAAAGFLSGRLVLVPAAKPSVVPGWAWPAGVCGAIYLYSQPLVIPRLGAALFVALAVTGQIIASLTIDHFGALGLPEHPVSPMRLAGAVLLVAGVVLITRF